MGQYFRFLLTCLRNWFCLLKTHAEFYSRSQQRPASGIHWWLDLCGSCRKGGLDVDWWFLRNGYILIPFTDEVFLEHIKSLIIIVILGCMKRKKKKVKNGDTENDWTELTERE